jgi:hypothetical protein
MAFCERGLSDLVAQMLIAFLVVLVAILVIASSTGMLTKMMQKPAFITVIASPYETSTGSHIISLYHKQGDEVNLNGTAQTGGVSTISIALVNPAGNVITVSNATLLLDDDWDAGTVLYLYPAGGRYRYSDRPPGSGVPGFPAGTYQVLITDVKAQVLLHSLPVTIE